MCISYRFYLIWSPVNNTRRMRPSPVVSHKEYRNQHGHCGFAGSDVDGGGEGEERRVFNSKHTRSKHTHTQASCTHGYLFTHALEHVVAGRFAFCLIVLLHNNDQRCSFFSWLLFTLFLRDAYQNLRVLYTIIYTILYYYIVSQFRKHEPQSSSLPVERISKRDVCWIGPCCWAVRKC